jgi:small subunit ribosomal protein S4e
MARGPIKHLKRLNAPKHWMLSKMDGIWAPRPTTGPHKLTESLPIILILRNRLKYALTGKETKQICMEKHVKVDGKVRTDPTFPAGFMDVVEIPAANDTFRLLYDTKGRYVLHRIKEEEKAFKLCRVRSVGTTLKKVPYLVTHDARTIRYPDPSIKVNDTVKVDIKTGKILDFMTFTTGQIGMVTKGANKGRVGTVLSFERHPGAFDIATIRDANGGTFATRSENVFIIGRPAKLEVTLPKGQGVSMSILEERAKIVKVRKLAL